jgi:hypothetical protein
MRERELREFIDIHKGETAWVFGKGPSLDGFDFSDAGKVRVGINDVVAVVPDCLYGFSNDRVVGWLDVYEPHHVLFTPKRTADNYEERPDCDVCVFEDHHSTPLDPTRRPLDMADCLTIREGTLGSVFQVLFVMGIRKLVCVGIDGGNRHSRRAHWRTTLKNEHYKEYNQIKHRFLEGAQALGMEVRFFNEPGEEMSNGKKTVLVTGNTFVRGIPYEEKQIVELNASDANDLVAAGQAVFTQAKVPAVEPVKEVAEVAEPVEVPEKRTYKPKRTYKKAK